MAHGRIIFVSNSFVKLGNLPFFPKSLFFTEKGKMYFNISVIITSIPKTEKLMESNFIYIKNVLHKIVIESYISFFLRPTLIVGETEIIEN